MRTALALPLVFLLACASFSNSDKKQAQLQFEIGAQELQNGAYPQALSSLLKAEKLDPNSAAIENTLGVAYFVRERYDEAEKHVQKALSLQSDFTDARDNLGRIYIETGRYEDALRELTIAENDLTYTSPEKPLINLGLAYYNLKDYATAEKKLQKALAIRRDSCIAHAYLGRTYYEEKVYAKAADELDRAVAFCQNSMYDEPYYYCALSYYELGQVTKAQNRLEEIIRLFPDGKYRDKAKSMLEIMRK